MSAPSPEPLEGCLSFLLGKAYGRVQADFKRLLAPHGVTPAQYAALKALWDGDGVPSAALVERLMLDPATVSGLLDRLEAGGLLRRAPDPHDRRAQQLWLTPEGRALRGPLEAVQAQVNASVLAHLSAPDAQHFKAVLAQLGGVRPQVPA